MLSGSKNKRPNCQQIIDSMKEWTLIEKEFQKFRIFDTIPEIFKSPENEFFLQLFKSISNLK